MIADHKHPNETAKKNGWINPVVERLVKSDDPVEVSSQEFLSAVQHLVFLMALETGYNSILGYERAKTPADVIRNLYGIMEYVEHHKRMRKLEDRDESPFQTD